MPAVIRSSSRPLESSKSMTMFRFWHTCGLYSFIFVLIHSGMNVRLKNVKYILQWAGPSGNPNLFLGSGMSSFRKRNCSQTNCFITSNKYYFHNFFEYDAVVFDTRDIEEMSMIDFPQLRFPKQKYILTATESAFERPLCKKYLDKFFNWTWTYKLNSDVQRPHLRVYNKKGKIVGPKVNMKWPRRLLPLTESMKRLLLLKTDAAAWFVNDQCVTSSRRENLVRKIHEELKKYGWKVDVFGRCVKRQCSDLDPFCREMLKRDYYFYFAFETSLADDYVTTTLLTALENYVVPIVYGGADYSRFLPPGSYLDARKLGPAKLAKRMAAIIEQPDVYHDFFRWRNHFRIEENHLTQDVCGLCSLLNNPDVNRMRSTYENIRTWFNGKADLC